MLKRLAFLGLFFGYIGCYGSQNSDGLVEHALEGTALYALQSIHAVASRPDFVTQHDVKTLCEDAEINNLLKNINEDESSKELDETALHGLKKPKAQRPNLQMPKSQKPKWEQDRDSARRYLKMIVDTGQGNKVEEMLPSDCAFLVSWGLYRWKKNQFGVPVFCEAEGTFEAERRFALENNLTPLFAVRSIHALSRRTIEEDLTAAADAKAQQEAERDSQKVKEIKIARKVMRMWINMCNKQPYEKPEQEDHELVISWGLYEWNSKPRKSKARPGTAKAVRRFLEAQKLIASLNADSKSVHE